MSLMRTNLNKSQNVHKEDLSFINKSTEQPHCEVSDCLEEVFSACPFCLIFMCYNHTNVEYNSCIEHNKEIQVASKSVAVESEVSAVNSDIILQTVPDNES